MASVFMKRDSNEQSLGSAIERLLKTYKLDKGVDEAGLISSWAELMGPAISKRTTKLYFKENGVLHIQLESSTLRNELRFGKQKLIDMLNEKQGKAVVRDIEFY